MKLKILLIDLFFVLSAIIGVGFATGKEIAHFFLGGKSIIVATIVFFAVFISLTIYILHIKNKYNITNLTQLNKLAFGKYYEIGNILLIVLFVVTSSAMLAGCDNLVKNYLGFNFPAMSLILSVITFFVVLGGIFRIKQISSIVMPILIVVIIINAFLNFNVNVNLNGKIMFDFIYPVVFCCENFITLISVLLSTKSRPKYLSLVSALVVSIIILLSSFAIGNLCDDMPMLTASLNVSKIFFAVYLIGVIFALFTTLQISTFHCLQTISPTNKNKKFTLIVIILVSQITAYLGFNFIVKYLYTGVGIMGVIYMTILITKLIIFNKNKK